MNGNNTFWPGVCDIMTNLFLIFLILYALSAANEKAATKKAAEAQVARAKAVKDKNFADSKRSEAEDERDIAEQGRTSAERQRDEAQGQRDKAVKDRDKAKMQRFIANIRSETTAKELNEFKQRSRQLIGLKGPFNNVVWVVDFSASIDDTNRLQPYKEEINLQITSLDFERLSVITFADDKVKKWKPFPQLATPDNRKRATAFIQKQVASGGTPTHEALLNALATPGVDTIVFFSDGQPTDTKDYKVILDDIRQKSTGQVINVVAFGKYFQEEYGTFLYQLAEQNGGQFLGR